MISCARLTGNLRLNDLRNVTVRNVGVGAAWDPTQPGGASAEEWRTSYSRAADSISGGGGTTATCNPDADLP